MASVFLTKIRQNFRFQKLGYRLSFYFISICIFFTLLTAASLLFKQYQADKESIYAESRKTILAVEQQLSRSLWNVDQDSTYILLEGMYRMPSIKGLRIVESLGNIYEYGDIHMPPSITIPLVFNGQKMGKLEVDVNDDLIKASVLEQFKVILISSTLLIGLIGFVFSYIVKKSVTQHLSFIRDATADPNWLRSKEYIPINLPRANYHDELSDLVYVLNEGQRQAAEFAHDRESYENQLEYQANFDVLTNLPNRRHIDQHLQTEIGLSIEQPQNKLTLFFIDLDGFKEVNDSLGHSAGDLILQASASRLQELIKAHDGYVARFGGDEFIACFRCTNRAEAEVVASKTILAFKADFNLSDTQLQLGCSIGIVMHPEDGDNAEELIRKADTAMYKAKDAGRNTFAFFDQSMMHNIVLHNTIKHKLKNAIENGDFEVYFQPLINFKDMSITGFEALLRWNDPELGSVRPDLFIPIAEKSGLIFDIDIWVFEQAITQVKKWRTEFNQDFIVAINFSPTNFHHREMMAWAQQHEVFLQSLDWVELEVTERLMLDDDPVVLNGIKELLKSGLQFSIDDFGTGYSSLGYIKKFSHILSKIKIDRMFITDIMNSKSDQALVKSIITLADSLSIEVLAEGVETQEQETVLIDLGCDYAQGYYYAKPIPVSEIPNFLSQWHAKKESKDKSINASS
ncbi:MAG: diguanylate cyclase (GGDEF)-like protein [Oleiphilaceae bacterium]